MDNKRPQHFTSHGLSRDRKNSGVKKMSGLDALSSLQKKKKVKPQISEEAAKQIALVLKSMLHTKK